MTFEILQARSAGDAPDPLYPTPGPTENSFRLEPGDGVTPLTYDCVSVVATTTLNKATNEVGRADRIKGAITITNSRFVFSCSEFRTGGGLLGYGSAGALVAVTANAISKAAAVRGTRGYTLVGHVRHEWLAGVMAQDYAWKRSPNALKLVLRNPTPEGGTTTLLVFPPNKQPASTIGLELVRRAVRARATLAEGGHRDELETWAGHPVSEPTNDGNGRSWFLPT